MKALLDRTWVETDNGVRIFLLAGKERALVIDTGMTGLDIRALVAAHTDLPYSLLNIFMFGPQRDFSAYIASLKRLIKREDFDHIFPSHAKEKVSRAVIPELIAGAEQILAGTEKWTLTQRFGKTFRVCDVGVSRFLCEPLQ